MPFANGHALIVGVGTYQYLPKSNVPITVADAKKVQEVLCDENLCGYSQNQVSLLHDSTSTRARILSALDSLSSKTNEDSTVLIFYAGHGDYGTDGNYYLTTHDTQLSGNRITKGSGVSEIDLLDKLRAIRAKRLLLVVNACHSGELSPNLSPSSCRYLGDVSMPPQSTDAILSSGEGRVIITASRPDQKSWIGKGNLTIFTQALVDGLSGKGYVPNNGGYIGIFGLYEHIYAAVKETANTQTGRVQEPELTVLRGVGPFPIAICRGATELGAFDVSESVPVGTPTRQIEKERSERIFQQLIRNTSGTNVITGDDNRIQETQSHHIVQSSRGSNSTINDHSHRTTFDGPNQSVNYFASARDINFDSLQNKGGMTQHQAQDRGPLQYLTDLKKRASTLSFGDPASWTVGNSEGEGLVTLEQIWTPLRVADSQTRIGKLGTHENMAEADDGADLRELFNSTEQSLVILGDPGSGKSTSMAMFAVDAARKWKKESDTLLPIWVNLASVTSGHNTESEQLLISGVPEIGIAGTRLGSEGGAELSRFLCDIIVEGKALLLLDGLDEVKEHVLAEVRSAIAQVLGLQNGTRVVITCRTFDYRHSTPPRKVPIERELELLPYSKGEQIIYVERWYTAAVIIGRYSYDQAQELSVALINELRNEELAELGESPLLLALLTLIHSEEAKLPDTRAVLCDRAIKYMLADSAKWRVREANSATIATPHVLSLAIELAYRSHLEEEETEATVSSGVAMNLVNEIALQICNVMAQADTTKKVPSHKDMAQRVLKSHGLLLDSGNGRFKFAHRSFQEFLVGLYYAAGAHHAEAISRGSSIHWREPFRLMASFAGHEGENLYYILTLIGALLSIEGPTSVSSCQLGAEMLAEIGRGRLALRRFGHVLEENGLWSAAQSKVAKHVEDPNLSLAERERSATVIGLLGDSRFCSNREPIGLWANLIDVPAGIRRIGSERLDEEVLSTSGGFLAGERMVQFDAFKIGRYPVTNAEFSAFVESDGYSNPMYWQGNFSHGWIIGDHKIMEIVRKHWLSTLHEHHAKEIRDGEINLEAIEEESTRRTALRKAPYYWFDRRFNQPNQPVVGINWWEATAFCAWATHRGHETGNLEAEYMICLPTEFEWEYASRPADDDRIYPWGDDWIEEKAHVSTNTLNMRRPAPVGIYLEPWPGAPCDLAGNVWEWTASLHLPYTEKHDAYRLSVDSLEERVVRGSSWYNSSIVAACSARAVDRSYNLFYDVGFRVVALHQNCKRACSTRETT